MNKILFAAIALLALVSSAYAGQSNPPSSRTTLGIPSISAGFSADGFTAQNGICNASSSTFTSSTAGFTPNSVGKVLVAAGCDSAVTATLTIGGSVTNVSGTTTAAQASGTILTFSAVPANVANSQQIIDLTTAGACPEGTTVSTFGATTVTASGTCTGVLAGDVIEFADTVTLTATGSFTGSPVSVTYVTNPTDNLNTVARGLEWKIIYNAALAAAGVNANVPNSTAIITAPSWLGTTISWTSSVAGNATETVTVGAGTIPAPLHTTIASFVSSTQVTLAKTAATSQAATQFSYGTDRSAALNALIAANPGAAIELPLGQIVLDSTTVALFKTRLDCDAAHADSNQGPNSYVPIGTTFILTSPAVTPFYFADAHAVYSCNFFWPGQWSLTAVPVVYPPLISERPQLPHGGGDIVWEDDTIVNSYDFWSQLTQSSGLGNCHFSRNNVFALRYAWSLTAIGESCKFEFNRDDPGPYQNTAGSPGGFNLANWASLNGTMFHIWGDGTATTPSSTTVDGITVVGNHSFGLGRGLFVDGGWMLESYFDANGFSGTRTDIWAEHGIMQGIPFMNTEWESYQLVNGSPLSADDASAIYINSPPPIAGNPNFSFTIVGGTQSGSKGDFIKIYGANVAELIVSNLRGHDGYGAGSLGGTYYYGELTVPNANVVIVGNTISAGASAGTNTRGILFNGKVKSASITGNQFNLPYCAVTLPALATSVVIGSNASSQTQSTYDTCGSLIPQVVSVANAWDKPNPAIDGAGFTAQILDNPDMQIDQQHEGASTSACSRAIDRWFCASNFGALWSYQRNFGPISSKLPYFYYLNINTVNPISPTAAQTGGIQQTVDTNVADLLGWGTANALPLFFDYCMKPNNSGTYAFSILNPTSNYSFVGTLLLSSGIWNCGTYIIPGPTSGNWNDTVNSSSGSFVLDLGSGSNYISPAPNTWQAANYKTAAGAVELSSITSANLEVTGLHLRAGTPTVPYRQRGYIEELNADQRFYAKSFPQGTAVVPGTAATSGEEVLAVHDGTASKWVPLPSKMFNGAAPTIAFFSPNVNSSANCYDLTQSAAAGAASASFVTDRGFWLSCAAGGLTLAANDQMAVQWTADTGK